MARVIFSFRSGGTKKKKKKKKKKQKKKRKENSVRKADKEIPGWAKYVSGILDYDGRSTVNDDNDPAGSSGSIYQIGPRRRKEKVKRKMHRIFSRGPDGKETFDRELCPRISQFFYRCSWNFGRKVEWNVLRPVEAGRDAGRCCTVSRV